nr:ORF97 Ld-helicase [Lymantria dispar multiple nucleopolyhedrovirus]
MAAAAISVNQIFENIFQCTDRRDECVLEDLDSADSIILRNDVNHNKRVVRTYENFQKLLYALTDARTAKSAAWGGAPAACFEGHDRCVEPHDWCVQDNCFVLMVRPFIERRHYERIKNEVDFTQFLRSNRRGLGNECAFAGDYVYWPNISITYFGWRLFVKMKLELELSDCVPLIHHRRLGNVNLFDVQPDFFLNIEMSLTCGARKLFVNGRTPFTDAHDELFEVKQADGSTGRCRINDRLVYSNKNFFNYLRDDINLVECVTAPRYQSLIRVNLKSLRQFGEAHSECKLDNFEALKITKNITPSSESLDEIKAHVKSCLAAIENCMVSALSKLDIANGPVLRDYFCKSEFINFDYLVVLVWRLLVKNQEFDFAEADIRLYLELLCEALFSTPAGPAKIGAEQKTEKAHEAALKRCEPYCNLTPKIFMRFCNHWTLFMEEDALESIGCYFAIHYALYYNNTKRNPTASERDKWNYTFESAVTCGLAPEVLARGFLKKIISANACLVFNGKHYTVVKKDDDLFKLTEKQTAISMSSVKFNSWKYLYFTEEGVYNLVINDYHSPTPFILGNTLLNSLTKKNEKTYLPESALNYMLDMGRHERDIYQIYHVAKICRDIRASKTNVSILTSVDNCERCKGAEQQRLNELFREVWHYDDKELVIMGLFLNEKKMSDLIANSRCLDCQESHSQDCDCIRNMRVDARAFRLALMSELFFSSRALRELVWSLIYTSRLYSDALAPSALEQGYFMCESVAKHAAFVYQHRLAIIDYLHRLFDNVDFVEQLTMRMLTPDAFVASFESHMECADRMDEPVDEEGEDGGRRRPHARLLSGLHNGLVLSHQVEHLVGQAGGRAPRRRPQLVAGAILHAHNHVAHRPARLFARVRAQGGHRLPVLSQLHQPQLHQLARHDALRRQSRHPRRLREARQLHHRRSQRGQVEQQRIDGEHLRGAQARRGQLHPLQEGDRRNGGQQAHFAIVRHQRNEGVQRLVLQKQRRLDQEQRRLPQVSEQPKIRGQLQAADSQQQAPVHRWLRQGGAQQVRHRVHRPRVRRKPAVQRQRLLSHQEQTLSPGEGLLRGPGDAGAVVSGAHSHVPAQPQGRLRALSRARQKRPDPQLQPDVPGHSQQSRERAHLRAARAVRLGQARRRREQGGEDDRAGRSPSRNDDPRSLQNQALQRPDASQPAVRRLQEALQEMLQVGPKNFCQSQHGLEQGGPEPRRPGVQVVNKTRPLVKIIIGDKVLDVLYKYFKVLYKMYYIIKVLYKIINCIII